MGNKKANKFNTVYMKLAMANPCPIRLNNNSCDCPPLTTYGTYNDDGIIIHCQVYPNRIILYANGTKTRIGNGTTIELRQYDSVIA